MPRTRISPLQDAIKHASQQIDKVDSLEARYINLFKGRGVFAKKPFNNGDFILEYRGELIDQTEAQRRRKFYTAEQAVFMFDFIWNRKPMCVDGSKEDGSFGRLVNDEHKHANSRMKLIQGSGKPHLCLFALKTIREGDEIAYDYGGTDWPWRKISDKDPHATSLETTEVLQSTLKFCDVPLTSPCEDGFLAQEPVAASPSFPKTITCPNGNRSSSDTSPPLEAFQQVLAKEQRHEHRLKILKSHHAQCEARYSVANMERLQIEKKRTLDLQTVFTKLISDQDPTSAALETTEVPQSISKISDQDPTSAALETTEVPQSISKISDQDPTSAALETTEVPQSISKISDQDPTSAALETTEVPQSISKISGQDPTSAALETTEVPQSISKISDQDPNSAAFVTTEVPQSISKDLKLPRCGKKRNGMAESEPVQADEAEGLKPTTRGFRKVSRKKQKKIKDIARSEQMSLPPAENLPSTSDPLSAPCTRSTLLQTDPATKPGVKQSSMALWDWRAPLCSAPVPFEVESEGHVSGADHNAGGGQWGRTTENKQKAVVNQGNTRLVDYTDSDEDSLSEAVTARQRNAKSVFMMSGRDGDAHECYYSSADSEEEYIPRDSEESSDSDMSDVMPRQDRKGRKSTLYKYHSSGRIPTAASECSSRGPLSSQQGISSSPTALSKGYKSGHCSPESLTDSSSVTEEEYIPDTGVGSSGGNMSDVIPLQKREVIKSPLFEYHSSGRIPTTASECSSRGPLSSQQSISSSLSIYLSKGYKSGHCSPECLTDTEDADSVSILAVSKKADGTRKYNKVQYCLFCGLAVGKSARHLERHHRNELDVARALSFNKGSKERRMQLEYLRNKGNFVHNVAVLKTGKGKLVAYKQPKQDSLGRDFMHCVFCQGLFARKLLWKHARQCKFKPTEGQVKPGKTRIQSLCAFAQPTPPGVTEQLWKLLSSMHQDKITDLIKSEPCIIAFGQHLIHKAQSKGSDQSYHVRQQLRELSRLVLKAREVTPLKTVQELLNPGNFMETVKAARHAVGFDSKTGTSKSPSLAIKLGGILNNMALFFKSEALIKQDLTTAEACQSFCEISQARWRTYVSSPATKELKEAKYNSPQLLPFTEDVKRLHSFLDGKRQQHLNDLKEQSSPTDWKELAQVTLAQVIVFNRRREGEVSKMPLSAFTSRDKSVPNKDVSLALSEVEQKLCPYFTRIEIRGKRDRKVPVLLTPETEEALELLVSRREECGVLKDNDYLFARPSAMSHFRGSDCIRRYARLCGAQSPDAISSTKLRKHVATLSNVLNLKDTELDQLADYLGHDIRVHRQYYRLPEGTLQLAKVSKILMALEHGRLGEFTGKNLDEIDINPNETVQFDKEGRPRSDKEETVKRRQVDMSDSSESTFQSDAEPCLKRPKTEVRRMPAGRGEASAADHRNADGTKASSAQNKGRPGVKKRPWQKEEIAVVLKNLSKFIDKCQVPRKMDCDACIKAAPEVLRNRDWKAIKFFVKNRITAMKRQTCE